LIFEIVAAKVLIAGRNPVPVSNLNIFAKARQRLAEKLEYVDFDPIVGQEVLYREERKVRSIRDHQIKQIPRLVYSNTVHSKWSSLVAEP